MAYRISASTPKASVAVTRDDPVEALEKFREFESLGLTEIAVTDQSGNPMPREKLQRLAASNDTPHEAAAA